jgi:hypothetical protein
VAAEPEPTEVDAEQLRKAQVWLQSAKDYIDQQVLTNLRTIPGMVRGAHVNPDDQQSAAAASTSGTVGAANTSGVPVTGLVTTLGPTHFGLFPNGLDMATRHINSYNSALTGLSKVSADLKKAIDATGYILRNYEDNEALTGAELSKIMTSPPYEPPAAGPGTGSHPDPSNPNRYGVHFE